MSVVEHIVELRKRVIYTVLSFVLFLIIGFTFTKDIYFWLVKDLPMKLTVLGPSDVLWIFFSIATVFAIVCTIPFAAIQIWLFVKPGLHSNEQKMTVMYIPVLSILFIAGLCFGYFIVMPFLFHFLTTIGNEMFNTMFTTEKYFHFIFLKQARQYYYCLPHHDKFGSSLFENHCHWLHKYLKTFAGYDPPKGTSCFEFVS